MGAPFGGEDIYLEGWFSYTFTILCTIAAINAFNMLDGMDGLAGAMALVALAALAFLSLDSGLIVSLAISLVFIGAIVAFLLANFPMKMNRHVHCFMGDSGSTLLGFAVAWGVIHVSQSPLQAAEPVTMLWIVALPLYELFSTVIRRGSRGISPFRSDTEHLHHILQRSGFGVRGAFAIFVALATLLAAFGITIDYLGVSDGWSFTLLIVAGICVVRLMYKAHLIWKLVPESFRSKLAEY
jgi:UDP-GlcNAc:undecaprenyl-phosphate GlcNAc-1-phosphate transferase